MPSSRCLMCSIISLVCHYQNLNSSCIIFLIGCTALLEGSNPGPQQWKCRVPITRPPESSWFTVIVTASVWQSLVRWQWAPPRGPGLCAPCASGSLAGAPHSVPGRGSGHLGPHAGLRGRGWSWGGWGRRWSPRCCASRRNWAVWPWSGILKQPCYR